MMHLLKKYKDKEIDGPSIIRNNAHFEFNDENLDKVRFVNVNRLPAVRENLTPIRYNDNFVSIGVDE